MSSFEGSGERDDPLPIYDKKCRGLLYVYRDHIIRICTSTRRDRSIDRPASKGLHGLGAQPLECGGKRSSVQGCGDAMQVERYFFSCTPDIPKPEKGKLGRRYRYRQCLRGDTHVGQISSALPKWNSRTLSLRRSLCYLCRPLTNHTAASRSNKTPLRQRDRLTGSDSVFQLKSSNNASLITVTKPYSNDAASFHQVSL